MVYGREGRTEQLIPFDVIPRVLAQKEWNLLETGSIQRVRALNQFLWDIYHDAEILRAGIVPADLIYVNDFYQPQMIGFDPPGGIYTHIAGIDIVRTGEEDFFVLEDNLRSPSGVSYMMENREAMMRLFPEQTKRINALMMTCGLYDAVGDFVFRVGMPAKSGVGGGIAGVIPGEISVCVWSPGLDESGNSLLGVWALERFVGETGLSVF